MSHREDSKTRCEEIVENYRFILLANIFSRSIEIVENVSQAIFSANYSSAEGRDTQGNDTQSEQ